MNNATYTGTASTDILFMTAEHDALFLMDENNHTTFSSIETFLGSLGNDILNFSSTSSVLMNLTIIADDGDDLIWSNAGNDLIQGGNGSDILDGGPGNDTVRGDADNDFLFGGEGNDIVEGGNGDDWLSGDTGADSLNGGNGIDTIDYSLSLAGIQVNLLTGIGIGGDAQGDAISNVENVNGSAYNDTITGNTADNVLISGGGDDTIIGGAGADTINGGNGIDTIDYSTSSTAVQINLFTGVGIGGDAQGDIISNVETIYGTAYADTITGNASNNELHGADGNDTLIGGDGDDILYGGNSDSVLIQAHDFVDNFLFPELREGVNIQNLTPPGTPALGIVNNNLDFNYDATATLTFRKGFAGYDNTLGVYRIDESGHMEAASILWNNVKTAGRDISHTIDLPFGTDGGDIGFFIIANGNNRNNFTGLNTGEEGNIKFIYDLGGANQREATIYDNGAMVKMVYDDGVTIRTLTGDHYHTTDRGSITLINSDGASHIVSGEGTGNGETLRIGFEDLRNLGDADYEDVLFDLTVSTHAPTTFIGDILIGGAGNDTLYGGDGTDIMVVGQGLDHIYGQNGIDLIVFDVMDTMADFIHGFQSGVGGDVINIHDILQGFDQNDVISNFVKLVQTGGNTELQVNQDGDVGGVFTALAIFDGGINSTLTDLINNGNFVMNQAASY